MGTEALLIGSLVAGAVGTAVQTVGAISAGQAQGQARQQRAQALNRQAEQEKAAAERQAKLREQEALTERMNAAIKEEDFRRRASADLATRRAILGGSGGAVGEGSNLLAEADFVEEAEVAALRLRQGGEVGATRLEQQAEEDRIAGLVRANELRTEAAIGRTQGRNAVRAGFIRGGSALLAGTSRAFKAGSRL